MYCALEDLEKCFQRADIDRRISDYMAANFSWSVAHSRALQAEDTTRAGHAFHQLLFATLTRILRILGHSVGEMCSHIALRLILTYPGLTDKPPHPMRS